MIPLDKDLQTGKHNLEEFGNITKRVLQYLPNVLSSFEEKNDYKIFSSEIAGTVKYIRPINQTLFIETENEFSKSFDNLKTISKDRMGKMFIDKILLERFVGHPVKVIGIFLNDVQRKESNNISFTLVSGLFMVYSKFLTELEGVYYLDPPPAVGKKPFSNYMGPFSELLTKDIDNLLSP